MSNTFNRIISKKLGDNIMEISISKTVQVKQFEPLTVTVSESAEVTNNQQYEELKKKVGACVEDVLATELERYRNQK